MFQTGVVKGVYSTGVGEDKLIAVHQRHHECANLI